jgi:hypothetical protein
MVVLRTALLAALAACYSPEVGDCTTTCNLATDCAPGQVCGQDGLCASAEISCRQAIASDAGITDTTPPVDAPPDAMPDAAPSTVTLVVRIDGRGDVTIPSIGTCSAGNGQMQCPFVVAKGVPLTLQASPKNNWRFVRWEDACSGGIAACTITPVMNVSVRARFEELDD